MFRLICPACHYQHAITMPALSRSLLPPYLFSCLLALLALGGLWYAIGQPMQLDDATTPSHKLQCVSYSPFDKDQSPFDQPFVLRPERMDADLALLAKRFQCIRTYSMGGMQGLPALARKHGLKLMQGAWVSRDPAATQLEVEALIASANANPDVVSSVIVGNEALLRKEVTAAQLVTLIETVKSQVRQPVTYADVWEFWEQHPEIAPAVDFLTIHLLPYWEDQPTGIDVALAHIADIRERFGRQFSPKDILIGETGWPSEGRQRETALPNRINQARFVRGFVQLAEQKGWHYNLIEAFDQPWKRESEGAVGGYWGLFDADRQDKNILSGSVSNLSAWSNWLGACLLLSLSGLLLAGRPASVGAALLLPVLAGTGASCLLLWAELALITSRFVGEWLWAGFLLGLNLLILTYALLSLSARAGWRQSLYNALHKRGGWWLLAAGFAGAVLMLGLLFDARYRSFPSAALLLPALFYFLRPIPIAHREALLLAAMIGLGIPFQLYQEGLNNQQAIGWALVCLLLSAALLRSARLPTTTAVRP